MKSGSREFRQVFGFVKPGSGHESGVAERLFKAWLLLLFFLSNALLIHTGGGVMGQHIGIAEDELSDSTGLAVVKLKLPKLRDVHEDARRLTVRGLKLNKGVSWNYDFKRDEKGNWLVEYQVVRWIEKLPEAEQVPADAVITKRYQQDESPIPVPWSFVIQKDDLVLMEVTVKGRRLWGGETWDIGPEKAKKVVRNELAGVDQVKELRCISGDKKKTQRFLEIAKVTKSPSLVLVLEVRNILHPNLSDERRMDLVKGVASILVSRDAPHYVRRHTDRILLDIGIHDSNIQKKRKLLVVSMMMEAFHKYVDDKEDESRFEQTILTAIKWRLRSVVPVMKPATVKQFATDLTRQKEFLMSKPETERRMRVALVDELLKMIEASQK